MTIPDLIDKQDTFEIIRDQIAAILAAETTSQQALAVTADEDPTLWKLRIFSERANPWEVWLNDDSDLSPLVNIWYDNSSFDPAASNIFERQKTEAIFNIDCYARGISSEVGAGGHKAGDKEAALAAHRALRLVRNILMAAEYTYLGLTRGIVWQRWPVSITTFQPETNVTAQQVIGARMVLRVTFNEYSPQHTPEDLDLLHIEVIRTEDDEVLVELDFDYT